MADESRRREPDRRHGADNGTLAAYVTLERALCTCPPDAGTCDCGFDTDPFTEQEDET